MSAEIDPREWAILQAQMLRGGSWEEWERRMSGPYMEAPHDPLAETSDFLAAALMAPAQITTLGAELALATGALDKTQKSVITGEESTTRPALEHFPGTWEWAMAETGRDPYGATEMVGSLLDPTSVAAGGKAILGPLFRSALFSGRVTLPKELEWMRDWPRHQFEVVDPRTANMKKQRFDDEGWEFLDARDPAEFEENLIRQHIDALQQPTRSVWKEGVVPKPDLDAPDGVRMGGGWVEEPNPSWDSLVVYPSDIEYTGSAPELAGALRQYHGTENVHKWEGQDFLLRNAEGSPGFPSLLAGTHSSAHPEIANTFADANENSAVFPFVGPGREAFYPADQPIIDYHKGEGDRLERLYSLFGGDDHNVAKTLQRKAFEQRPYLLKKYIAADRHVDVPLEVLAEAVRNPDKPLINLRRDGDPEWGNYEWSFNDYMNEYGGSSYNAAEITDAGVDALRAEGYHGIQYINTSMRETEFSADKRSFINFDPSDAQYVDRAAARNAYMARPNAEHKFRRNIPSRNDEEWMQRKREKTIEAGRKEDWPYRELRRRGLGGPAPYKQMGTDTGFVWNEDFTKEQTVLIPTDRLKEVRGQKGEQAHMDQDTLDWMRGNVMFEDGRVMVPRRQGDDIVYKEYAPLILVDQDGVPWINEGNHRIAEAIRREEPYVRVYVRWFNGGEKAETPWSMEAIKNLEVPALKARPRAEVRKTHQRSAPQKKELGAAQTDEKLDDKFWKALAEELMAQLPDK